MRCSTCSHNVRPIVALDIDGTLADYHRHFLKFSGAYLGMQFFPGSPTMYDGQGHFRDWWMETFKQPEEVWRDVKLAYRQGAQKRSQPPLDHGSELHDFIQWLSGNDIEVWMTTTRPYLSLDRIDRDTRFWLERHGVDYYGLLYDDDKYTELANRVDRERVIAVLDDQHDMYDAAARLFGERVPMLRVSSFNRAIERPNMVGTLGQAINEIRDRLIDWSNDAR